MNIFDVIRRATSRTEPFHTRFLADALRQSIESDSRLFRAVWDNGVSGGERWPAPAMAVVAEEDVIDAGRVDVVIRDEDRRRVLAIEAKTVEGSVRDDQLESYLNALQRKYPDDEIRIVYLTPFNRLRAGEMAGGLHSVRLLEVFREVHPDAVHMSWLDIADVEWNGGDLWEQHRDYVRRRMCDPAVLQSARGARDRGLGEFVGDDIVAEFWTRLTQHGISYEEGVIDLLLISEPDKLRDALEVLIHSPEVNVQARRADSYPEPERTRMLESEQGAVHREIMQLSDTYPFVWIQGRRDYGIRVSHPLYPGGVSLATSSGDRKLIVGRMR